MDELKKDHDKNLKRIKKAAEVQMRNIKILARDHAKKLIAESVNQINHQF